MLGSSICALCFDSKCGWLLSRILALWMEPPMAEVIGWLLFSGSIDAQLATGIPTVSSEINRQLFRSNANTEFESKFISKKTWVTEVLKRCLSLAERSWSFEAVPYMHISTAHGYLNIVGDPPVILVSLVCLLLCSPSVEKLVGVKGA